MTKAEPATTTPVTRVRPNRNEEGRLEILTAATTSFMRLGYARASIDEIADQLGATKGRVYHYYRSKADILMDIHRHVLDMMLGAIRPLAEAESAVEAMREMAFRHAMIVMENLAFTRVALLSTTDLFVNEKQQDFVSEIGKLRSEYESLFVAVLERGMASGEFRQANAKVLAKPLLGSLNWTTMWYVDREDSTDATRREIAEIVVDYVVGGVRK
ncbi:TetR/AcrR family transcriptional regulator [Sphingosinicella sp. LY1275]|uniref:TetR/AcrR family transcriptional regulator n=1 Tax=Sphingosinicella sp. LY1275 TaxID=3095379 RepID=UPI002ADEE7C0|nr:TetR/AcrR family transcriptional regulator [Sphingosinicella sp. LY1275]MEA1015351.1 TetR/AcrR family transcriptional regulator [Sphingosinicella sp. LY1275]